MTVVPDPITPNGHQHLAIDDLPASVAARYRAGATLDQLAVECHIPPSRCRRLPLDAGVTLRPLTAPRPGPWFDPSGIPLDRQREIAEAYRAFPGHEVAAAYGIPLPWVAKIAHLLGVRKTAPRGYRKRRGPPSRSVTLDVATTGISQGYTATAVVQAYLEAPSWESAVAQLRQAGTAIQVVRVCGIQRLVAVAAAREV